MNDIRVLLKTAARRLEASAFLSRLHVVACVIAGLALVLMLVDRGGAEAFIPWVWVAPVLAGAAFIVAAGIWWNHRRPETSVALEVDERLDLRERLSTALHVQKRTDVFAMAAMEDAVRVSRDPRSREQVRRLFKVTPPRGWYVSPLLVLAGLMLAQLDPLDLFGEDAATEAEVIEAKNEAQQTIEAVVKTIEQQPELNEELGDLLGDLTKDGFDPEAPRSPEEIKRQAIKKVTDLSRKLNEIVDGEKGMQADAIKRKLKELNAPMEGDGKELAEALNKGNFAQAKQALEKMMEKMEKGELNDEQANQLAENLEQIAKQLEQLAKQQEQLEEALKQAGMDPQLAQNPQALQQQIQNNQNLNQQQKQQLQQMAQAQQAANQMCQGLGQACQQMAQGMQQGQQGQMQQGMGQAMDQLNGMEQLEQMLKQAQAAANACQGQCEGLGQGLAMQQAMQQWRQSKGGMGGWGAGQGGQAPKAPTPTGLKITKPDVKTTGDGPVIARTLIDGPLQTGESKKKVAKAVLAEMEGYDEALADDELPRKYDKAIQHYFGELENQVRQIEAAEEKAEAAKTSDG